MISEPCWELRTVSQSCTFVPGYCIRPSLKLGVLAVYNVLDGAYWCTVRMAFTYLGMRRIEFRVQKLAYSLMSPLWDPWDIC